VLFSRKVRTFLQLNFKNQASNCPIHFAIRQKLKTIVIFAINFFASFAANFAAFWYFKEINLGNLMFLKVDFASFFLN
jgi:hypothetical protein